MCSTSQLQESLGRRENESGVRGLALHGARLCASEGNVSKVPLSLGTGTFPDLAGQSTFLTWA